MDVIIKIFGVPPSPELLERVEDAGAQYPLYFQAFIIFALITVVLIVFMIVAKKFSKLLILITLIFLVISGYSYFKYDDLLKFSNFTPPDCSKTEGLEC